MTTETPEIKSTKCIRAESSRMSARLFSIGNLLAFLPGLLVAPFILLSDPERTAMILMFVAMIVPPILWFGFSIMIYIIARHHPHEVVGYYTQQSAYRYYGMIGLIIPVGTFFGTDWELWIITGGAVGLVLVPWTIWDLIQIQKYNWQDIEVPVTENEEE